VYSLLVVALLTSLVVLVQLKIRESVLGVPYKFLSKRKRQEIVNFYRGYFEKHGVLGGTVAPSEARRAYEKDVGAQYINDAPAIMAGLYDTAWEKEAERYDRDFPHETSNPWRDLLNERK
jgi:hypothetical protein